MTVQEIFIKWLKYNNYYNEFVVNFNEYPDYHKCKSVNEYLNRYSYTGYIWNIPWESDGRRYDYWRTIYFTWKWFCRDNIKTICKLEKI